MGVQPAIRQCQNNNEVVRYDGTSDAVFSEGRRKKACRRERAAASIR